MKNWLSKLLAGITPQGRNAFRVSMIFLGAVLVVLGYLVFHAIQTPSWQLWMVVGLVFALLIFEVAGMVSIWRGRHELGIWLAFIPWLFVLIGASALVTGLGIVFLICAITIIPLVAGQTLSSRQTGPFITTGIVLGIIILIVDLFIPTERIVIEGFQTVIYFLLVVLVPLFGYMIVRQFRNYSLRTKLIVSFLILSVVSVSIVASAVTFTVQSSLQDQIETTFAELTENQRATINSFFIEKISTLRSLAISDVLREELVARNQSYKGSQEQILANIQALDTKWVSAPDYDPLILNVTARDQAVNPVSFLLHDFTKTYDDHVEVILTDRYGATVAATDRLSDYYQADESWWQAAWNHEEGAVYISDPEYDESAGVVAILMALPILDDETGEPIGVLRSTVVVESLFELLQQTQFGETGYSMLFDKKGNVLMDPRANLEGHINLPTETVNHIITKGDSSQHPTTVEGLESIGRNMDIARDLSGKEIFMAYSTLQPLKVSGRVFIDDVGTTAGFERFCIKGDSDIAQASRLIKDSEAAACQAIGRNPIAFPVGIDAVAVVVSGENDFLTNVTMEELALIFSTAETWSEVRPEWPDEPISRIVPTPDRATFDYFVEAVLDKSTESLLNASNLTIVDDYDLLIQDILRSHYAIGFVTYGRYLDNAGALKVLSIDGISAEREAVEKFEYPLARLLYLYSDAQIMQDKPQVAVYINYFLAHANQEVESVGYFPLNQETLNQSKTAWLEAVGTVFSVPEAPHGESNEVVLPILNPIDYPGDVVSSGSSTVYRLAELIVKSYHDQISGRAYLSDQAEETLDEVSNLGWTVLVRQDTSEALAAVKLVARNSALISSLVLVIAAVLAIVVARFIAGPISQLTNAARQFATGDLSARTRVTTRDEIGMLASTFDEMANQLGAMMTDLEQRVSDRTRALATSTKVSRRLATILDQKVLVSEVVNQINNAFGYYHTQIYFFDATKENLVMAGGTGESGKMMLDQFHKVAKGRGLVGRAAASNQVVFVPDTAQNPQWLPNLLLPDTRAEIAIPIAIGDAVLGVLDIQHNVPNGLNQEHVDALVSIANQVAVAMQNSRSYTEIQRSQSLLTEALNISRLANWEYDLEQDLFTFNDQFYSIFRTTAEKVGGYKLSSADYTRLFVHPEDAPLVGSEIQKTMENKDRQYSAALEHRIMFSDGEIGYISVRINVERDENGNVTRWYGANQDVTERRKLEELNRKRASQQEAINLITQKIQNTTTVEAALQIAARELGHALRTQTAVHLDIRDGQKATVEIGE